MTVKSPLWLEDLTYTATDMRRLVTASFPNPGVIAAGDLQVIQHGAGNRSVDVTAGAAVVTGTAVAEQGNYLFESDATVNVPLAAAPGSGNSRYDLIVARVQDQDTDGGSTNVGEIVAITGTAATTGSQVVPSLPTSCLELGRVLVGPSVTVIVTANILDLRTWALSIPAARIHFAGTQSIPTGGAKLTSSTTDWLKGGMLKTSDSIVVPVAGKYRVAGGLGWASSADNGIYGGSILHNGSAVANGGGANIPFASIGPSFPFTVSFADEIDLAAGDTVGLFAYTNAGTETNAAGSWLTLSLVTQV